MIQIKTKKIKMIRFLIILFCTTLLMGCSASYKLKKFNEYAYKDENRSAVALVCNNLLPCITTGIKIEQKIESFDSIFYGDSINCPSGDVVKCPDIICNKKVITNTITKEIEDTRKLQIQKKEFDDKINILKKEQDSIRKIWNKEEERLINLIKSFEKERSSLLDDINKLQIQKKEIQKKSNKRGWIIYGTLGILAVIGFLKIRNKLSIF